MRSGRSLLQFSLRSLFLLTLLVALGLGWFMTEVRRANSQTEAIMALGRFGDGVAYRFALGETAGKRLDRLTGEGFLAYVVYLRYDEFGANRLGAYRATDADLVPLEHLPYVESLTLYGAEQLTDAGWKHLEHLTRIRQLDLTCTSIDDVGLKHLSGLSRLKDLSLVYTRVSDRGLESLRGFPRLRRLWLGRESITDASLRSLRGMCQLRELCLIQTAITDGGLEQLRGLTGLRKLQLDGLAISGAGLRQLRHLSSLRELSIVSFDLTDLGLEHLKALTELDRLHVRSDADRITPAGMNALRRALPRCRIDDDRAGSIAGFYIDESPNTED